MSNLELKNSLTARRWVLIVWPAFLAACIFEALVFSMVDPGEVHWPGQVSQPARQGVYTVAFFCFWLVSAACSYLVLWLEKGEGSKPGDSSA
ncbi:MAG: hypothetical protein H7228_03900 [Polaromonas sp.]|nr:hypothetical protein [Polaromonas sp.]